jgi:hypothetical protein
MYAIKAKEIILAEYIIKATNKKDINHENLFGHTALTMACKMGFLEAVELLVQNGADYSLETSTGNTPLIEAVKSGNLRVVEYLAKSGALVYYKTYKHRKTSMDWAKVLGYKMIERSLDIYGIVQFQVGDIFKLIACGETDKVKALVVDGEFFSPVNTRKLNERLHSLFIEQDQSVDDTKSFEKQVHEQDEVIKNEQLKYDSLVSAVEKNEESVRRIAAEVMKFENEVHRAYRKFEDAAASTMASDLEELTRMTQPDMTVRLAVLIFGIMYNILNPDPSHVYDTELGSTSMKTWWKSVMTVMMNSADSMKRLKGFSLAKLSGPFGFLLLSRAREIYQQLKQLIDKQLKISVLHTYSCKPNIFVFSYEITSHYINRFSLGPQIRLSSRKIPSHQLLNRCLAEANFAMKTGILMQKTLVLGLGSRENGYPSRRRNHAGGIVTLAEKRTSLYELQARLEAIGTM